MPDEKRRKLDAKSEKGILVGYCGEKDGYRIWMPNSNKVVTSRDVIFKESVPTFNFDITIRNDELSNQTVEYEVTEDKEETTSGNEELGGHGLKDRSKILKPQRYRDAEINIAEGSEHLTYKEAMHEEMNKTAFLYGNPEDQNYIKQPEGFNNHKKFVWKLKKSLWT